jgi:hypothetical protein
MIYFIINLKKEVRYSYHCTMPVYLLYHYVSKQISPYSELLYLKPLPKTYSALILVIISYNIIRCLLVCL